jgi:hypothetical protein
LYPDIAHPHEEDIMEEEMDEVEGGKILKKALTLKSRSNCYGFFCFKTEGLGVSL